MRSSLLAVSAVAILTLSACGSDSDSSAADTTVAEGATDVATDSTDGGDETDTSVAVDTEFSGDDSDTFCALAVQFDENDPTTELFTSDDPEQLKVDWATAEDLISSLTAEAPAEIKPDFEILTAGFQQVGDLYEKYDWDFQALGEAASTDPDVAALADTAEADAASDRVDAYLQQVCGIDTEN